MTVTRIDSTGKEVYLTDPTGNEIGVEGKTIAGILLALFILLGVIAIVAHWPDKMPPVGDSTASTQYQYKWFAITYLGKNGRLSEDTFVSTPANTFLPSKVKKDSTPADETATNSDTVISDSAKVYNTKQDNDTGKLQASKEKEGTQSDKCLSACNKRHYRTIDLNILILLLVALAGFLGNMIHISASFTNFIGAGKFRRSWTLWYFVKPFTAAGLAVGVYIIFRAGFLNSAEATASVNLYGVVGIALLAGLYTDMATQKLKEIFGVVFQSSTARPNPLELPPLKITSVYPAVLPLGKETEVIVSGIGFDSRTLKLKIDTEDITGAVVLPNSIVFKCTATTDKPVLFIYDEKGVEVAKYDLKAEGATTPLTTPTVTDIAADNLTANTAGEITITGTGLDTAVLVIKVNGTQIADTDVVSKAADTVKFNYTATAAGDVAVSVTDDKGTELMNKTLTAV